MDREQVRAKIVRKASEEILVRGYTRVTMDDIASGLGMSKKTLYRVFPGKREMLMAVLTDVTGEIERGLLSLMERAEDDFTAKLRRVMEYVGIQYSRLGEGFLDDLRNAEPEILANLENFREDLVRKYFHTLVEEGIEKGAFRKDIDARVLSMVYLASIRYIVHPRTMLTLETTALRAYENVFRLLFEGMLTDESRSRYRLSMDRPVAA
ncbi:MAG: TetR/AcrR family transcriptional regulator [Fibrobacteria bacterium]|nr:TetR/AcrR family transcriptional regulator [Fibrobacteria bacterium]